MVEPYLLTGPDGRLIQSLYTARAEQRKLLGFDFTGAPRAELAWQDLRRVRTEGFWSPGDMPTRLQVTIKDGKLLLHPGFANADLGISVPPSMMPQAGESYFFLAVNNADLLVVDRYRDHPVGEGAVQVLSVYEKASGEWHNVTFPAAGAAVRGFGAWLASTRTERKRANTGTATIQVDPGNEKESPGSVFRKNVLNDHARTSEQISVNGLFFQAPYYFAGELLLYNAHSRQKYTIETGQGDSEILLVSDGAVYYRVNDTLYKATIGKTSIENPVKLLQDDQIQFAHWAFFGPPVPQQ